MENNVNVGNVNVDNSNVDNVNVGDVNHAASDDSFSNDETNSSNSSIINPDFKDSSMDTVNLHDCLKSIHTISRTYVEKFYKN